LIPGSNSLPGERNSSTSKLNDQKDPAFAIMCRTLQKRFTRVSL
jgi:hypothetical protein